MKLRTIILGLALGASLGCQKEFLEKKPSSAILAPNTLADLNGLLERSSMFNLTGALAQISADEYEVVTDADFNSLPSVTERSAYIWAKDILEGETLKDWEVPFTQIFTSNSVIEVLQRNSFKDQRAAALVMGWAAFNRAFAYFDLAKNFCKVYDPTTATTDLGLPIRLQPAIDEVVQRATLQKTFDQIFKDLDIAAANLSPQVQPQNRNRPSVAAVHALRSRIYLYQGNYGQAEHYADSALLLHNVIADYNTISQTSATPFGYHAAEVIFQANQIVIYGNLSAYGNMPRIRVIPSIYQSFKPDDLRRKIFFVENNLKNFNLKRGYTGGGYPFTGLATDEVYLIKSECLARRGQTTEAMEKLNSLLLKRFVTGKFIPYTATATSQALAIVLEERKKELLWRGIRWSDLKRLNRDGANITLVRQINGSTYSLPPNDPRWVFPIPDQEIILSGIQQNIR